MDWNMLGAMGEIFGGFAVIASLLYLARQLRQTRKTDLATNIREMHQRGAEFLAYTDSHPGTFETLRAGIADYDSLEPEEKEVFNCWASRGLIICEQVLYMHLEEALPDSSYDAFINFGAALITTPGGANWWRHGSTAFTVVLRDHMNGLTAGNKACGTEFYNALPHWQMAESTR